MIDAKIKSTMDQAEAYFESAQNEFSRPEEDLVASRICITARQSIANYLTGYLLNQGLELQTDLTIEELWEKCCKINSKFYDLNLDIINRVTEKEYAWLEYHSLKSFIDLALHTKKLAKHP